MRVSEESYRGFPVSSVFDDAGNLLHVLVQDNDGVWRKFDTLEAAYGWINSQSLGEDLGEGPDNNAPLPEPRGPSRGLSR
jgi:hypothetical protein